jgi:hypothetical protein
MRPFILLLIKTVHTLAFAVIAGSIGVVFLDGARGRPRGRTGVAAAIALGECAVFAANGFVCPLTPLAERYGARRGSVTDLFLPDVIARNLTWIATPILVIGLVLNALAWTRHTCSPRATVEPWSGSESGSYATTRAVWSLGRGPVSGS